MTAPKAEGWSIYETTSPKPSTTSRSTPVRSGTISDTRRAPKLVMQASMPAALRKTKSAVSPPFPAAEPKAGSPSAAGGTVATKDCGSNPDADGTGAFSRQALNKAAAISVNANSFFIAQEY